MTLDTGLRNLVDKQAIQEVTARYGRSVDWLDVPGIKECFHPDSIVHFGETSVDGYAFCEFYGTLAKDFKMRHHHFAYPVVALESTDRAFVEFSAIYGATYKNSEPGRLRDYLEGGRYHWWMERRDGVWRVREARIFLIWSLGQPTPSGSELGLAFDHGLDTGSRYFVPLPPER